ncbi:DNA-binding transcriptional MerR regulator [Metabacillus malikii]|uniref:DNA-binding transcriptional MerR regulator n=1 Tax=Metabacillus malikii TaxID=1504265 RepID=A0ABT9ZK54_9BACI|nr:DNA-binding transcriptional MerR regulator [Metabacillus malikii]
MFTIGQVAKFLGVSRDTLKFYEKKQKSSSCVI